MDGMDIETGEIVSAPFGVPPAVAAAIIAVKKQVKQLGADDRNEHGKYNFVSVDKFYATIGKLMAEAGLALLIDETASDVKEGKSGNPWLFANYEMRFVHESGSVSPPMRRAIALPINGPQTFGAAQSYIEKQFLRQVFKVPTGERDADDTPQGEDAPAGRSGGRTVQGSPSGAPSGAQRASSYPKRPQAAPAASADSEAASARWREMRDEISGSMTVPEVRELDGCLAWQTMERMVRAAEPTAQADILIQRLRDRIEDRVSKLEEAGGY